MADDTTPKDRPPVIVEIVRPRRTGPVTLEVVKQTIDDHASDDAANFGKFAVELATVRREQATRSQTFWQTIILALISAGAVIAAAAISAR